MWPHGLLVVLIALALAGPSRADKADVDKLNKKIDFSLKTADDKTFRLEQKPIAVFAAALGTQVLAEMPITERNKIPLLAGPSTRRVTQQGAKYFFLCG